MKHLMKGKTTLAVAMLSTIASVSISSSALAVDLTITDTSPSLFFADTDTVDGTDWWIWGEESFLGGYFEVRDLIGTSNSIVLQISHSVNNENSFMVDSSGDINLADGSVFIDRSQNRIGIGTTAPVHELDIVSSSPSIRLEDTAGTAWVINRDGTSTEFDIANETTGASIFRIEDQAATNSLVIDDTSNIGLGTASPAAKLHVTGAGTRFLVQDTVVGGSQVLMELEKNGVPAFRLTNTGLGSSWDFTQTSGGRFSISRAGSGQLEVQVTPTGNMIVAGSVIANGVTLTSSRNSKTDITDINTADIMEKLKKVEVAEWRYKKADKNDRHISPMAEDFYALFQLGPDNKGINPNDLASVAIIAAKELQSENATLKSESLAVRAETQTLKAENAQLKQRMASLERLVTNLASSGDSLPDNGKQVALSPNK